MSSTGPSEETAEFGMNQKNSKASLSSLHFYLGDEPGNVTMTTLIFIFVKVRKTMVGNQKDNRTGAGNESQSTES